MICGDIRRVYRVYRRRW